MRAERNKRTLETKSRREGFEQKYARLIAALRHQYPLGAALQLLEWDQDTLMPAGTLPERAQQIGTLAALIHETRPPDNGKAIPQYGYHLP